MLEISLLANGKQKQTNYWQQKFNIFGMKSKLIKNSLGGMLEPIEVIVGMKGQII
jgi:hypothetical protein